MDAKTDVQKAQEAVWNGPAARAWVDGQERLDRLLAPFETLLAEAAAEAGARDALDIGCGTGATTLAIARGGARATGVDLSAPMIALARARAERERLDASFVVADAQTHGFAPAAFDMIVSRFGIMFFADPVAAFANIRRALRPGARLRAIAWRSPGENPFMTAAERAAAPLLDLPPRDPGGPGQFAFADRDRVAAILRESGWREVEIGPLDVPSSLPAAELEDFVTRMGPVGAALRELDPERREPVVERLRAAFAPFVEGSEARYTAACWDIGASA